MYRMKADGVVFYDPSADDMSLQVVSPKASYELNKSGSLTFTILPGNVMYTGLHKMKTVVTLEQDDEIIFCGRVLETVTDKYNQKEVYCEGELAYLLDSIVRPYTFKGNAADLFRQLVTQHNAQVEDYKRFEIGIITAVDDETETEVEGDSYSDTLSEIRSLLVDEHDGYLRVRRENGVRYLDYVSEYDHACTQEITFGVNLVDIENKVNAQELCTVLIPIGAQVDGEYTTIANANGGNDSIEDEEAIAQYGRIVKTHVWDDVSDPNELLQIGQEYMQKMHAETTLTITAVDLHTCGADVDGIRIGDTVHLNSVPHGVDRNEICTKIDLDIEYPEKSEYTFGLPIETLTQSHANSVKEFSSSINDQHRWLTETNDALKINVEAINLIGHRTTQIEGDFNAAKAEIALKASQGSVDILEAKVSKAEVRINGAEAYIALKAGQDVVDKMGERLSSAELRIDGAESSIALKADKTDIEGFLTVSDGARIAEALVTEDLSCNTLNANASIATEYLNCYDVSTAGLSVSGTEASWKGGTVVTGITVTQNKNNCTVMLPDGTTKWIEWVESVTVTPHTSYINYLGKNG